jgi:peptide/nickel transport system substrate-binding protein
LFRTVTAALLSAALLGSAGAQALADTRPCGTVVMPLTEDVTSLNPLYGSSSGYNEDAYGMMYLNLLWIVDNARIDWSRSLARSITTSDDQSFIITLRPWSWSDGVPVTAADVALFFRLTAAMGPSWPGYGAGGLPMIVKSVDILGPLQIRVVTVHKVNPTWFIYDGLATVTPLPAHAWGRDSLDAMYQAQSTPAYFQPVDGPLMVQSLNVGIEAVFVPNPKWQGPALHLTRLVFEFLSSSGAALLALQAGTVDLARLPNEFYGRLRLPHTYADVLPQEAFQNMMSLNFRNPGMEAFRDVAVRQAMADAIDQPAIIRNIFHGAGDAAYAPVEASMGAFVSPAVAAGRLPVGYDPARARALLAAAGFAPGPDGIMGRDGKRLSFTFLLTAGSATNDELYETVQSELRAIGIEMKIQNVAYNEMLALEAGAPDRWQATGDGLTVAPYPSGESLYLPGAYGNAVGYDDATATRLIERNLADPDPAYLYAYEDYISAQQPEIFLPRGRPIYVLNDRLHGLDGFWSGSDFEPDALYCTPGGAP